MLTQRKDSQVDQINDMVLDLLPGDAQTFHSTDSIENEDGSLFSIKYLQSLNTAGRDPVVRCKVESGNLDLAVGLCNGTRLLSTRLHTRVLEAILLTGDHAGQPVSLPWITLKTGSSA